MTSHSVFVKRSDKILEDPVVSPEACPLSRAQIALCRLVHRGPRPQVTLKPLRTELKVYVEKTRARQKPRYKYDLSRGCGPSLPSSCVYFPILIFSIITSGDGNVFLKSVLILKHCIRVHFWQTCVMR